jgi:hypothetical protein
MLNGEVFITPDQIDSQQPDFTTLPATLFNQVDVIKSPTASQTSSGISGALNLHTYRPWDLPSGFTYSYSADAERGSTSRKTGPEASGLVSYNADGRWGLQVSGDFSDTTRANSNEGLDQYGVILNGENAASAGAYNGFLGAWNGAPIPFADQAESRRQCRRERRREVQRRIHGQPEHRPVQHHHPAQAPGRECIVPGGPRPRAQVDQRLLLRAPESVRPRLRHANQFHQLAGRDLRAVEVERHRRYRAESVQHAG